MLHKSLTLVIALSFVLLSMIAAQAEDPYFIESGGVVSMEAEHFSRNNGYLITNNPTIRTHWPRNLNASGFSGTGYAATNYTGVRIDYDILFTNTGTYTVNLRSIADYDAYGGGEQNGFCAQFDGRLLVCSQRGCGMNVAKWASWAWVTRQQWPVEPLLRGTVTFYVSTPGKHTFSISPREEESWFDKIVLQRTVPCGNSDYQGCLSGTGPAESQRSSNPPIPSPTATTGAATSVSSGGATLNGTVNPNGSSTTVVFHYGKNPDNYDNTATAEQSPLTGSTAQAVSAQVSGLTPNETYYFRVRATNSGGTVTGSNQTFNTPSISPVATTGTATSVSSDSATLNGTVNPNDAPTTVVFEYGETTNYGNTVPAAESPLSGSTAQPVSADISGLEGEKIYHFRTKATNSGGTGTGDDQTFNTPIPDELIIDNKTFENGTVSSYTANVSITFGPGVVIESGATVTLTAPLVKGVDDVTVYEGANLTIKTQ